MGSFPNKPRYTEAKKRKHRPTRVDNARMPILMNFFLTDFLVRGFHGTIVKGMGLDRHPELREMYFQNYMIKLFRNSHSVAAA